VSGESPPMCWGSNKLVFVWLAARQLAARTLFSVQTQTPLGQLLPLLRGVASGSTTVFPGRPNAGRITE
jgi:hypothetical protein